MYEIEFSRGAGDDLKRLRAHDRSRILDAIEDRLSQTPSRRAGNRKLLENLVPPFEAISPVWELRVGDFRVVYDVDEDNRIVFIRAIRLKPPHRTTEEIL
jgi:mRNA-degrading endonuclease RelE of RelBE toxin-antitoxin system